MTMRIRRAFAVLLPFLVTAGLCSCTTMGHNKDEDLGVVPPAQPAMAQTAPVSDARITELQTSMTELLERLDVLSDRMARLESATASASQPPAAPAVVPTPHPVSQSAEPAPAIEQTPAASEVPAAGPAAVARTPVTGALASAQIADDYRNAIMLFGKGRIPDSRKGFQRVYDADPTGDLADNALFWLGETYFAAGDYATAMRFYTRVTTEFGEQNKAPDAMYKTAMSYARTGDLGLARKAFEECIRRYPFSTAAGSSRLELKRIKY